MEDKELEELENTKQFIKGLFKDLEKAAELEPTVYIMPKGLYQEIFKKVEYLETKLKCQTVSLKTHLKEKVELKRKIKELMKNDER